MQILSLGAGVQSTTIALMAAKGEIEKPDCAIFADTGFEPKRVYDHLEWLKGQLPFPVHAVSNGNLKTACHEFGNGRFAAVPFFLGNGGMGRRQCTHEYKITPINRKIRELIGKPGRAKIKPGAVTVWIGISLDEISRMKNPRVKWQKNRWPLIEQEMTRWDCKLWLERNNYPQAPKSSCVICPFHNNAHWRDMKDNAPAEWHEAIQVDSKIRCGKSLLAKGIREQQYLHSQRIPLSDVNLSTLTDLGQMDLFGNECDGLCAT